MVVWGRILPIAILFVLPIGQATTIGQDRADRQKTGGGKETTPLADDEQVIRLSDLPAPPKEFAKLINLANVRFVTGGEPQSTAESAPGFGRLAGETRFTFRYRYDSHAQWEFNPTSRNSFDPIVLIRVRFRSIKLIQNHDVWFRRAPSTDQFWEDRVVRHEFDHVRISSDKRVEELFLRWVRELETIRVPLSEVKGTSGRIDNTLVQQLIEKRVKQILARTTDMVRIRYQELDRLTKHGLRPIPEDADFGYRDE